MKLKRGTMFLGAAFSTVVLSLANATGASAATLGHIWNDSPSVNECLATAADQLGQRAIMWTCDSEPGQQWYLHWVGADYMVQNGLGGCLEVGTFHANPGSTVWVNSCNANVQGQHWSVWGSYTKIELKSANQFCLSVANGSTANGANVIEWTCQGTPDQEWEGNVGG